MSTEAPWLDAPKEADSPWLSAPKEADAPWMSAPLEASASITLSPLQGPEKSGHTLGYAAAKEEASRQFGAVFGLPDLSTKTIAGTGADFSKNPIQQIASKEVMTPEEAARGLAESVIAAPFTGILPRPSGDGPIAAVVTGLESSAEQLATPANALIGGALLGAPSIVQTGASFFFGKQMLQSGVQQMQESSHEPDPSKRIQGYTEGAVNMAMGALASVHPISSRPEFGGVESKQQATELRGGGMSESDIKTAIKEGNLQRIPSELLTDDHVDNLVAAREAVRRALTINPDREEELLNTLALVNNQLSDIPKDRINASAARIAEQGQPTAIAEAAAPAIEATPSSVDDNGTSAPTPEVAPATAAALEETPNSPTVAGPTRRLFNWGTARPDTLESGRKDYDTGPAGSWWFKSADEGRNYGPNLHEADVTLRSPAIEETTPVSPRLLEDMRAAMKDATGTEELPYEIQQHIERGEPVTMSDLLSFTGRPFAEKIATGGKLNNRGVRAAFTKVMEDHGFDGMEIKNGTQIVAFRPEYISNLKASEGAGLETSSAPAEAPAAAELTQAGEPAQPGSVSPMDQLRALEADAQEAPVDAKPEKMVATLQKLGRLNRDSTKAISDELRYYSDEELGQLQDHLGTEDADPKTIAKAITGRDVIKETDRPSAYKSEDVGAEARPDSPEIEAQKDQFGEDYVGGPGAMGPRQAAAREANKVVETTALKRAVVDVQHKADGHDEIEVKDRVPNTELLGQAEDAMANDISLGKKVVNRILATTDHDDLAVSRRDAATMLIERVRLRNLREQITDTLSDAALGDKERAQYESDLQEVKSQMDRLDQASRWAGTAWSDFGRLYQEVMKDDYSLEALEKRAVERVQRELEPDEKARLEKLSKDYAKLQEDYKAAEEAASEGQQHAEMARIMQVEMDDIQKQSSKQPKISKPILDIARSIVERLNVRANAARTRLTERLSRLSAGVDPGIVLDVAEIMAGHIGEIGLKSAEVSARVLAEFGDKVKPYLKAAYKKARELIDAEGAPEDVKETIRKTGVGNKESTTGEVKSKIKADAKAGDELSQKYVADLVRAHLKAGVHGEDAVMAAVHKDVQEAYPDATERDVRRAYTEYGKVKFPSKEAVAAEMRELRTLVRLQESISRETEGLDSLHTGLQRDKATQAIREKQKQLNELLKKRQGPPSPEKLASRNEARKTALRNAISDLDKQLRTGEKPSERTQPQYDAEVEQLQSEKAAMVDKLREIQEETKPKQSAADKQIEELGKRKQRIEDILSGKKEKTTPNQFDALTKEAESLQAEIHALNELGAQMRRDLNPKDPNAAKERALIKRLEDAAKRYQEKLDAGDFSSKKKVIRSDSAKVADARAVTDARREAYEAAKKAGRPVKTPTEIYNQTRTKAIAKEMEELQRRLDTKDFGPKPKPVPKAKFAATAAAESALRDKRQEVENEMQRIEHANRSPQRRVLDFIKNTYRFVTAETVMGHGGVGMMTHAGGLAFRPLRASIYWRNFGRQFGMWSNKNMHSQLIYKLTHDPEFETWKKAGASIDPDKIYTDYGMYAKWLGKLNAAGQRGFDALKLVRMEMNKADWKRVSDEIKSDPEAREAMRKSIAEMNNKATGAAGRDNSWESAAGRTVLAKEALFAPKLYLSRWSRALFDPIRTVGTAVDWGKATPAERKIASIRLRNAAEFVAAYTAALTVNQVILKATGSNQEVNFSDPTKKDWLKFKAGKKEIMADGGLLDPVRLMGQVVWGDIFKNRENERGFEGKSRYEKVGIDLWNYIHGKMNPSLGLVVEGATGQDAMGRAIPTSIPHLLGGEKPQSKYKGQVPYGWTEWFLKHAPIPVSQGSQVVYDELRKNGMDHPTAIDFMRGAAISFIGASGVHISTDYKAENSEIPKHVHKHGAKSSHHKKKSDED